MARSAVGRRSLPWPRDPRAAEADGRARSWPSAAAAVVHLCVLWAFAIVQPLFDVLARNAEFFVARGTAGQDVVLLALALTFLPPLALAGLEGLIALISAPVARGVHLTVVGLLGAAFAIGVLKRIGPADGAVILPAAAAAGAGIAAAYLRVATARRFLTALAPAPVVFVAIFLLFSPVSALVLQRDAAAAAGAVAQASTPVVLVIFDELPTISLMDAGGAIDAASYPQFARLAATSTWYRNATTVADGTYIAVAAILAGHPPTERLPIAGQYPQSVFTMLEPSHDIQALEPITRICPERLCARPPAPAAPARLRSLVSDLSVVEGHLLLPEDMASGLPPVDRGYEDFSAEERGVRPRPGRRAAARPARGAPPIAGTDVFADRLREAERFVASVAPQGARPPLYMAHLEVPHVPWRLMPSGHQYPASRPSLPGVRRDQVWTRDPFVVEQALQRHTLQVGYADEVLGRLMRRLERAGLWDRALVVVTSDHGVGLRPGGSRRPVTEADFAAIAGVPLFVKLPGQRSGAVDDAPARTLDVLPTVASVLGVAGHAGGGGVALNTTRPTATPAVRNGRTTRFVGVGAIDAFARARDAELARQRRLLPRGLASVLDPPRAHPLIGRRLSTLAVRAGPARAEIDRPESFARVSSASGVLPVYVSGRLDGERGTGLRLAVAVNGRIRAVGRSYAHNGERRFSVLVPRTTLRRGRNTIDVLALEGGVRMTRLAATGS